MLTRLDRISKHVTTFIRKPTWISPPWGEEYRAYSDEEKREFRDKPGALLKLRRDTERGLVDFFPLLHRESQAQKAALQSITDEMKRKINDDDLARKLIPDYPVGCRRLSVCFYLELIRYLTKRSQPGPNYLESLTKPNVTTSYSGIKQVTPTGCVTDDNQEHSFDVLICATGFDTSYRPQFPVVGRNNVDLRKEWKDEPRSYLGLAAHGFPNYFMLLGPNNPIGNGPLLICMELTATYIATFMNRWQKENIRSFDPKKEAVDDFMEQKDLFMQKAVWSSNCKSWYKNGSTGKVTAVCPGSSHHYMETIAQPRYEDYDITYTTKNRFAYLGNGFSQMELNPNIDPIHYIREKDDDGKSVFPDLMSTFNVKDIGDQSKNGS